VPDLDRCLLLTGATGFVGMEVLARLVERTDHHVACLVRARDDADAEARLRAVRESVFGDREAHADRMTALAGDLTQPRLGLGDRHDAVATHVRSIVHSAASVAFDLPLEESRAINVAGTERVLELAGAAPGLERFTYVSTAYVAGERRGTVGEDELAPEGRFRNTYERSKAEAEALVAARRDDLPVTVVRPSIVVGESTTGWTAAFNVLYAPLRAYAAGGYPVLPARRRAPVDVVPVDFVADAICALHEHPEAAGGTFHAVAGPEASSVGELVDLGARRFEQRAPRLVPPRLYDRFVAPLVRRRAPSTVRRQLERSSVYFPYFAVRTRFDDARARSLLDPLGIAPPPLRSYFDRLVDFAEAARWGRRPLGRADAAAASPPADARRPARRLSAGARRAPARAAR
jgi:thioester reductase-like protein